MFAIKSFLTAKTSSDCMAPWIQNIIGAVIVIAFILIVTATVWHLVENELKVRKERLSKGETK